MMTREAQIETLLREITRELAPFPEEARLAWTFDNPGTSAHACLRDALAVLRSSAPQEWPESEGTAALRFVKIAKAAADDSTLTDAEVRNIVRYISAQPITERQIERTRELAVRFGWEQAPSPPSLSQGDPAPQE